MVLRRVLKQALGVLAAGLLIAPVGHAQNRPQIEIQGAGSQSLRVAVQKFAGPSADKFLVALTDALEFSSVFRAIDHAAFLAPTTTRSLTGRRSMVCSDWTQIGADVLVEGVLRREGTDFTAEFRAWDVPSCRNKPGTRYRQLASAKRSVLAKRMADEIVKLFTGLRGVSETELAFVSRRKGNPEIYVMEADGGNQRAATANRSINNFPAWSPTGDAIVYTSYKHDNRPMLYLSTRGRGKPGRILGRLSAMPQYRAVFNPKGDVLAVVMSPKETTEIYRVAPDGTGRKRLTSNRAIDISPAWSPDGNKMAFVSDRSGSPQIYIMNADGLNVRRLTFDGSYNTNPAWSPDGSWIAYQSQVGGQFDIWLIDPDGSVNLPLITHPRGDESPSWAPDSRKLAFSSTRRGSADIYVVDANGENLVRLTRDRGDDTSPNWGPYPRRTR